MKPAILVTSHPNNDKKEYILKDFGNFISQYGIDHYLFSNYPANKETQLEFKEAHFLNYNPPGPALGTWIVYAYYPELMLRHNTKISNWCYSGTHLILKGIEYLKSLGYTHVYVFIYDTSPNFPKLLNFIEKSDKLFIEGKKGVFFDYDKRTAKNEQHYTGVFNNIFSCEVNFFIELFTKGLQEYGPNSPFQKTHPNYLCENYWEYLLKQHSDVVEILPNSEAIRGVYESSSSPTLPTGEKCLSGAWGDNKVRISIESKLDNIIILNSKGEDVSYKLVYQNSKMTLLEIEPILTESYYMQGQLLFTYNKQWADNNWFEIK